MDLIGGQELVKYIKQKQKQMMKILSLIGVVSFVLVVKTQQQQCHGLECAFKSPNLTPNMEISPTDIAISLEKELRRAYWYYLKNADILHAAVLDVPQRLIFYIFHRNIVGTFFSILEWKKETGISKVNTLVRLGNGYGPGYKPAKFTPPNQSQKISLSSYSSGINFGDQILRLGGQDARSGNLQKIDMSQEAVQQRFMCGQEVDEYMRKTYWYYLRGALLINKDTIELKQKIYTISTYTNIVGTFLAVTSCQKGQIQVNTLVRLGKGTKSSIDGLNSLSVVF